jgi:surface carbohydrate biosynthesis protein
MNKSKKIKVLCFTDFNSGRDVEMVLPVRFFAERFLNCEFIHVVSFDIYRIYKDKPDIVLTPNSRGSTLYWKIARAAHEQNIPLFSLESEGNFATDDSFHYWGYNLDKKFYQEYVCCWSERTRKFLVEMMPDAKDKIVLTGGIGFDRFKIYKFVSKESFLKKYKKDNYKKIVGYGAWTFNKVNYLRGRIDIFRALGYDNSSLNWVEEQRRLVNNILEETVKSNRDVLFIFKRHPQDKPSEVVTQVVDEMQNLTNYENVLCFNEEESLQDLINVSDVWTCYESTTALEAWLMGKQTVFINPEPEFPRADIYKGSAVAKNPGELKSMLNEFYSNGRIAEFFADEKILLRNEIIKNSIGFDDGFNHVRASLFFEKTVNNLNSYSKPVYKFSLKQYLFHLFTIVGGALYVNFIYKHLYKFKKHLWVFENYKMKDIERLHAKYLPFLDEYYSQNDIDEKYNKGSLNKTMIPNI